jgi:hypothetical protein
MAAQQTEQRNVGDFTAVSLDGIGTLNVNFGETCGVSIKAEPNALPLITTEVENGTLTIHTKLITTKFYSLKTPPVYSVTMPALTTVTLAGAGRAIIGSGLGEDLFASMDGAGEIQLIEQTLNRLRMKIAGAGNIKASGTATIQDLQILGTGNFSGEHLQGDAISVNIAGAGRAKVNAERVLTIEIGGVGSVTYLGNPHVTQHVGGLGRVNRA